MELGNETLTIGEDTVPVSITMTPGYQFSKVTVVRHTAVQPHSVGFHFWMVTFPVLPLTGFIFLNLFGLLECLVMWLISMPAIKV